jgi:hypothetical protein
MERPLRNRPRHTDGVFLPWGGGKNPAPGQTVRVLFRHSANGYGEVGASDDFYWEHDGESCDIIGYRVIYGGK